MSARPAWTPYNRELKASLNYTKRAHVSNKTNQKTKKPHYPNPKPHKTYLFSFNCLTSFKGFRDLKGAKTKENQSSLGDSTLLSSLSLCNPSAFSPETNGLREKTVDSYRRESWVQWLLECRPRPFLPEQWEDSKKYRLQEAAADP